MSGNNILELTLRDILLVINPSRDDWSTRFQIIDELRAVIQSVESLRGATVEPYGSFVSNLFSRWGDLDISIELPNGSYISSAEKRFKQTLLRDVLRALRRKGGWHKLQFIANARVPILKLESNFRNISCDISINNLDGQMKSKFLFWINEIDGRFRDMVLLARSYSKAIHATIGKVWYDLMCIFRVQVKEWAKAHGINNSKFGTLNSYALSLLVIFHFQTCVPALLPPLKDIYPGNLVDDLTGVRAVAERRIEEICAASIGRFRTDRFRVVNRSSLSELFTSFLAKFLDISLRASEQGLRPYSGQWEHRESNIRWLPKTCALFVEDPFEQPVNAARSVTRGQIMRISQAFQMTHRMLISSNQNRGSLIGTLTSPQSFSIARTQVSSPSESSRANPPRTHLEVPRPVRSPSQVQQQFQNTTRPVRRTNNMTVNRPTQGFQTQSPHMWRPRSDR